MESLQVDVNTGKAVKYTPDYIQFKDAASVTSKEGKVRPVAPFLEVFAITDEAPDKLVPLTVVLLEKAGLSVDNINWDVEAGNIKIFRRTGKPDDKIIACLKGIKDHTVHSLNGECRNFLDGKELPLGTIQFIAPTEDLPEIRLRFTPAHGKVYGSDLYRHTSDSIVERDPVIKDEDQIIYDSKRGDWRGYKETPSYNPSYTNPAQIFAGYADKDGNQVSWGYLDDECDGFVQINLDTPEGTLSARAHFCAGPPAYAPDTLPVRVVSDELEQILLGPDVDEEVSIDEAEDIVRRALETVRLMNTAVMNGNPFEGKLNTASTMVRQDTNDFGRLYEPIMAQSIVDNLAVLALHERVFNGLTTGAAPWFSDVLRRPDQIGDLSNKMRRKMPGLMRGADGRHLTLTHRQINTVIKAAVSAMFQDEQSRSGKPETGNKQEIKAANLTAQLHYKAKGNPFSALPRTAISNCFPGLEFDFRNLWRRAFKGIVLIENNNYVIDADNSLRDLIGCRLVAIENKMTMVPTSGPVFPDGDNVPLETKDNPNGVSFMEWSNSLAAVLQKQGEEVVCHFTKEASPQQVVVTAEDILDTSKYQQVRLTVNNFFEENSASLSDDIVEPGELTQGLCSPWQNDYRECACYYWAASRPDFVNVVPDERGLSAGDNWMAKRRSGQYIPDDRKDSRLLSYDDLFKNWQGELNFVIKGKDAIKTGDLKKDTNE